MSSKFWGNTSGAHRVSIALGRFRTGLGDVGGVGAADVWGVDGGEEIFDVWGLEGVDGGDNPIYFWSEMEGCTEMVGMKGGSIGISKLGAIEDDLRVANAHSKNLGMFVTTMEVWSFKI